MNGIQDKWSSRDLRPTGDIYCNKVPRRDGDVFRFKAIKNDRGTAYPFTWINDGRRFVNIPNPDPSFPPDARPVTPRLERHLDEFETIARRRKWSSSDLSATGKVYSNESRQETGDRFQFEAVKKDGEKAFSFTWVKDGKRFVEVPDNNSPSDFRPATPELRKTLNDLEADVGFSSSGR